MTQTRTRAAVGLAAVLMIALSVLMLERERSGLAVSTLDVGGTPATLHQRPGEDGPIVVVAHGFAGSRQIMQAYSFELARAGYRVVAFDFEGHGRNPVPMSGDVTEVDGTTALLVAETRRVIAAARALPDAERIALLGHSMATDVLVRASIEERRTGTPVDAVVAISMFSPAVTAEDPVRLLMISGQAEGRLREAALDAVHEVDPAAAEGEVARDGPVSRRAVVAPWVEHVGVLFSPVAVDAARDWLDETFDRQSSGSAGYSGLWILALLGGIVLAFRPLVGLLPRGVAAPEVPARRFLLATIAPAVVVSLLLPPLYTNFLPVLVADYLMLHLALIGVLQLALVGTWRGEWGPVGGLAFLALTGWGIVVFGVALDRYAASFWPTAERVPIVAALCVGTIPFMIADSFVTEAGRAPFWRRCHARVMLFLSLGAAAILDPEELTFVLIVLPVFLLFFLVHGLLGRWVARRCGPIPAGLGLGLCLAWALGVSFPLFAAT